MIRLIAIGAVLTATLFNSCIEQKVNDMETERNINYPAAYIVNGEDASISVIKLADNTVTETIALTGSEDSRVRWPHHISQHQAGGITKLAIAVPGMDLSAGHGGGMHGMKGRILIMDAVKGMLIKDLEVPVMNHNAVYSPDGREIWTSRMEGEGMVLVYDADTYKLKTSIEVRRDPAEVTFSADGSKVYVANGGDNTVSVIDPAAKSVMATIAVGDNPVAAWVGYDGNMYVDNEHGNSVSVISVASDSVIQTIDLGFMPGSVAHNAQRKELWVTDPQSGKLHYYTRDTGTGNWIHGSAFNAAAGAHAIAFTNDGESAYVTNQEAASVSVINAITHTRLKDIDVGKKPNGILIKY